MPILELTSRERSDLRSAAHPLKPVVLIGDKGLSDAVLKEIDLALTAHGLIKVRAGGEDRETREALLADICEALSCAPVHHLGKILILYRPSASRPAASAQAAPAKPAGVQARKASEPHTPKKMAAEGKKLSRTPRRRPAETEPEASERPSRTTLQQAGKPPRPSSRKTASSSHGVPRRAGSALSLRAGARRAPAAGRKTVRSAKKA